MLDTNLPIHPRTGLRALGISKRGPIWPVLGGNGEGDGNTGNAETRSSATDDLDSGAKEEQLGDGGKKALAAEREARKAADRKIAELAAELEKAKKPATKGDTAAAPKWQRKFEELKSQLTAEREAREKAEKAAATTERIQYGLDKGLPKPLAELLVGLPEDAVDAKIDELKPLLGGTGRPNPNPQQGQPSKGRGGSLSAGRERYVQTHAQPK